MAVFMPWQMGPVTIVVPVGQMLRAGMPVRQMAGGGFPVPEALTPAELPPAAQAAVLRLLDGPPKPAVTPAVMNATQLSMIGPDLPFKDNV